MKRDSWIILLAVISAVMSGCSRDDLSAGTTPDESGSDGTAAYLAIRLGVTDEGGAAPTSRADIHKEYDDEYQHYEWFNKGTKEERAVIDDPENNRIWMFYADNSYYGATKLEKVPSQSNVYVGKQPGGVPDGAQPTQFLVILNGDPSRLDAVAAELKAAGTGAVRAALNYLNRIDDDPENPASIAMYNGYFTMTSSIYMNSDEFDDAADRRLAGVTEKADFHFFPTKEEALLPENLLVMYVERILAKFTLRVQDGELKFSDRDAIILKGSGTLKVRENYKAEDGSNKDVMSGWSINLACWGVNGLEANTYLFKTLVQEPGNYPWRIENDFFSRWNEPRLFRSYWAVDENYDTGFYPDQYREALMELGDYNGDVDVDSATGNTIYSDDYDPETGLARKDYTLIYRPYSAFTGRQDNKYAVENTYDVSVMNGQELSTQPYLRCGTHLILTAQLLIDEFDSEVDYDAIDPETGFLAGVSDKYFSNGLYWSKTALIQNSVATLLSNISYNNAQNPIHDLLNGGNVDFIEAPGTQLHPTEPIICVVGDEETVLTVDNATDFFDLVPAFIKGGDGWVSLYVKEGVTLLPQSSLGLTGRAITKAQLVSYIYRFTNLAKHYNEGRMYYALPVKHTIDSKNFEKNTGKVDTGDYGVVRNHWYRLTLNSVLVPGTPVDDPDQPIIPNNEPDDKSLGVEVEVLPWHVVDITVDQLH